MPSLAHKDDLLCTPPWLFRQIEQITGLDFNLDVCANSFNTLCRFFIKEDINALDVDWIVPIKGKKTVAWCNPPRSKNGKFVEKALEQWEEHRIDIVMLLCWNDLGNKYGEKLFELIVNSEVEVHNLGKIKFYKDGKETEFPSRLTYFWCWFKGKT